MKIRKLARAANILTEFLFLFSFFIQIEDSVLNSEKIAFLKISNLLSIMKLFNARKLLTAFNE